MYRVLIVDDEIMIRRGLSKIIKWEQIGFELAGAVGGRPGGPEGVGGGPRWMCC